MSPFTKWVVFVGLAFGIALGCGSSAEDPTPEKKADEPADDDSGDVTPAPTTTSKPKPTGDEAPVPSVVKLEPSKATVGSPGPTVLVSGQDFVARSVVQLDGAPLATTFVSATELRATLPTEKLAVTGVLRITAGTAPPGGGASQEVPFAVENPVPEFTQLSPLSVVAGEGDTPIVVRGRNYVQGASIVFGTTKLATTVTSATELRATVPGTLLGNSASTPVKVENPQPGGGPSQAIAFTITNPSVTISGISPTSAPVGSGAQALTVTGTGFVAQSAILFNGQTLATAFQSATSLQATVPAALVSKVGAFPVAVQNPPPGGGVSAPLSFQVSNPTPNVTALDPSTGTAGAGATVLEVKGTGFVAQSQIFFDGVAQATTFRDGQTLEATLTAAKLAQSGAIAVRVETPSPGGGASQTVSFVVNNPSPSVTTIAPSTIALGAPATVITLTGTGFVASSVIKSNNTAVPTTFVSATQIKGTIPAAQLSAPGSLSIVVTNGPPGGGASDPKTVSVGCDATGVDVALTTVGATSTFATDFANATVRPRFTTGGTCPPTLSSTNNQPARSWVVQNRTGAAVTLSAWAVCTASGLNDDAYLTFYRRNDAPTTNAERLACTGVVAEGAKGAGAFASPEAGASQWCPGLTKANGGGLSLGVCERAVVHIQAWSMTSTTYVAPPTLRIRAE